MENLIYPHKEVTTRQPIGPEAPEWPKSHQILSNSVRLEIKLSVK
jgi:hypothetical protein